MRKITHPDLERWRMLDPTNNVEGKWICQPCRKQVVIKGSTAQKKFCRDVFGKYVDPEWKETKE